MQPYFNPRSEDQSSCNSDPHQFVSQKFSSTSTADSYVPSYYPYMDTNYARKEMETNFVMRFNSLELDNEEEQTKLTESCQHISESHFRPPHPTYSTKEVPSVLSAACRLPMNKNASPFVSYRNILASQGTTNLLQVVGTLPLYSVPQYYGYQAEMVPVPVLYGYYDYPSKSMPKRYFRSKKQVASFLPETSISTELTEKAIILMKEYESSGDYKKLEGEVSGMAKVQSGSRFLQEELDRPNPEFLNFILQEVLSSFIQLRSIPPFLN
jgi:hypothetical protein